MKIKEPLKKIKSKKSVIIVTAFALLCCVGAANNYLHNEASLNTSSDYVQYEQNQDRLHNGEVLVDSIDLTGVKGTSKSAINTSASGVKKANATGAAVTSDTSIVPTETSIVSSDDLDDITNTDSYFQELRASVTNDRNEIMSMLTDVIDQTNDQAEKTNATNQKLKIIEYMNTEKNCESLIRNKGFTDVLVLITDKSVNVTLSKQEISDSDVAKVLDIVMRETGRTADQIVVQSKY